MTSTCLGGWITKSGIAFAINALRGAAMVSSPPTKSGRETAESGAKNSSR
jgi:hypothetical protein